MAQRRAYRDKKIAKRVRIVLNVWGYWRPRDSGWLPLRERNRLNKYNLNCGCGMCQIDYRNYNRAAVKRDTFRELVTSE